MGQPSRPFWIAFEVFVYQRLYRRLSVLLVANTWASAFLAALVVDCWQLFTLANENPAPIGSFAFALLAGLAIGSALILFLRNPARVLGIVPHAWLGVFILCLWLTGNPPCLPTLVILGGAAVMLLGPLSSAYHDAASQLPDELPVSVWNVARWAAVLFAAPASAALASSAGYPPETQMIWLAVLAGLSLFFAWACFYRPALEGLLAFVAIVMYRFPQVGPGVGKFPRHGPVVVIANHAAWLDPFWLGKVIPRPITPMMSSKFYDLPVISFLMRRVIRAIRVQDSAYRQSAPELDEAVRRLDQGECVMIFPEGWLRRREDQLIRHFHQGVWRILRERPHTPVVAFWIEGGWGSWWSHRYAPVFKGKSFDILRKITLAVSEPEILSAEILADQRKTRHYLKEKVFALRAFVPNAEPAGPPPKKPFAEVPDESAAE
jgi:1-acyl-sn-glycerol-3-phosphate acyltransferase